jgi:hypothetical protein
LKWRSLMSRRATDVLGEESRKPRGMKRVYVALGECEITVGWN